MRFGGSNGKFCKKITHIPPDGKTGKCRGGEKL